MKKVIPFRKEVIFPSNIYEITSISLEHSFKKDVNKIEGIFKVGGEYRATENSIDTIPFNHELPFLFDIDDNYDIKDSAINVDDFYYEIINNNILGINIEVSLDNVSEILRDLKDTPHEIEPEIQKSLFSNLDDTDNYVNYKVYIVRAGDTIETIMSKFSIDKTILAEYNSLEDLKLGDKLVIPYVKNK